MATASENDTHVNFFLPPELKQVVERAAALRGQSLNDFAISTLVENARRVLNEYQVTVLSNRGRDVFLAMLDDDRSQPSAALLASAASYKQWLSGAER